MKKIISIIIVFLSTILISNLNINKVSADENIIKYSKSAVLIELETGKVLYEHNSYIKYEPASMTKMMTMKLVLDAVKSKRISMDDMITTSEYASKMGGSQIFLSPGEKMKVQDLFKSMVIASANDAAVSLAEAISGSEKFFVEQMNNEVKKLGLVNTNFSNATGLPTENHYSSSYDMAMIARSLLLAYEEEVIPYSSCYEDYIRKDTENPFWLVNTNKLIKHIDGIDGLKTGWTEGAGYCLTCTKKQDGMRLISVVMGSDTVIHRTEDTLALLNYGFNNFEVDVIYNKGDVIEVDSNLLLDPNKYHVVTSSSVYNIRNKNESKSKITTEVEIYEDRINNLHKKKIGILKTYVDGNLLTTTDLELIEDTKRTSFIKLLLKILESIF